MMRPATLLALLLVGALFLTLFTVKYQVQDLEQELTGLNQMISADRRAVHVLEAEWSHLNNPSRLRNLAVRYLGMGPVDPVQLGSLEDVPERLPPVLTSQEPAPAVDFVAMVKAALAEEGVRR